LQLWSVISIISRLSASRRGPDMCHLWHPDWRQGQPQAQIQLVTKHTRLRSLYLLVRYVYCLFHYFFALINSPC
jgi:hypothetical protein